MVAVGLAGEPWTDPLGVVRRLGAVQSQDFLPAKWSIASRCAGIDDAAMDRLFDEGRIIRTHVLRPTWHFVLPGELQWLLGLTAPRVHQMSRYYYRQQELDDATLAACGYVIERLLDGGAFLTRSEIAAGLAVSGIVAAGPRMGLIMMWAELEGMVCSGPRRGRQHTYASMGSRIEGGERLDPDEALAALTRRYFAGHGPASRKDFRWWSSLTLATIDRGLEMVAGDLVSETVDGVEYWWDGSATETPGDGLAARLLPGYDEYIVGYSETKWELDRSGTARRSSGRNVTFNQVVLMDSQVVGQWRPRMEGGRLLIEVDVYRPLEDGEREALGREAVRYGTFAGREAEMTFL